MYNSLQRLFMPHDNLDEVRPKFANRQSLKAEFEFGSFLGRHGRHCYVVHVDFLLDMLPLFCWCRRSQRWYAVKNASVYVDKLIPDTPVVWVSRNQFNVLIDDGYAAFIAAKMTA